MGLYRKSQQLLYEEFIRRSYQGIDPKRQEALLRLNLETISLYKQERDVFLRVLGSLGLLLQPSKSISLKESLCRVCEALDVDYYVLYLFNKRKMVFEKKVHYSKTPVLRDAIMRQSDRLSLGSWEEAQSQQKPFFEHADEVREEIENNKSRVAALVWRKALSAEAASSVRSFVKGFSLYALETF